MTGHDGAPAFHLRSTSFCPVAQVAKVALGACGATWTQEAAPEGTDARLSVRVGARVACTAEDAATMLEVIARLHPSGPLLPPDPEARRGAQAVATLGLDLRRRLSAVTRAVDSAAHDMAVYRLREGLLRIETMLPSAPDSSGLDLAGAVLAPTLWRLRVLDAHHETFLMTGLPRLSAWGASLAEHPHLLTALGPDPEASYLGILARRGAALTAVTDAATWRLLVGHKYPLNGTG